VIGATLLATSKTSREMFAPNPTVTAANVMNVLSIAGFFAVFLAVPSIVINAHPMHWVSGTVAASAIILLLPSVGALVGSQLSGRLIHARLTRLSSAATVTLSGSIAAVGLVVAAIAPRHITWLLVGLTLVGVGTGAAFNGIVEAVSRSGPVASRTGVIIAGRYIGGALGGALTAVMLDSAHSPSRTIDVISITFFLLAGFQVLGTAIWRWRA
jgi:MFS family permease